MEKNSNIEMITGDPKKAINKLAMPTIFSLLLMFLNNLIDSFWVSGINIDALAALGFISPLYFDCPSHNKTSSIYCLAEISVPLLNITRPFAGICGA